MSSKTKILVRYAETDQMGVVHHAVYPVWMEAARTDFIKQIGVSYSEMEAMGILLPVHELSLKYLRSAKYEDSIIVETTLERVTPARIQFGYRIYEETHPEETLVLASSTNAWVGSDFRPMNVKRAFPALYAQIAACVESAETSK